MVWLPCPKLEHPGTESERRLEWAVSTRPRCTAAARLRPSAVPQVQGEGGAGSAQEHLLSPHYCTSKFQVLQYKTEATVVTGDTFWCRKPAHSEPVPHAQAQHNCQSQSQHKCRSHMPSPGTNVSPSPGTTARATSPVLAQTSGPHAQY